MEPRPRRRLPVTGGVAPPLGRGRGRRADGTRRLLLRLRCDGVPQPARVGARGTPRREALSGLVERVVERSVQTHREGRRPHHENATNPITTPEWVSYVSEKITPEVMRNEVIVLISS